MSYYRRADGSSPSPLDQDAETPAPLTAQSASTNVAPRRPSVVFEIGGEPLVSPNATVDPIAVAGPPRRPRQANVFPVVADMSAILAAQQGQHPRYVYDHSHCWFNAQLTKRLCFKAPYEASRSCSDHTCRAELVDGTRCPNTVYHPRKNPFCLSGYHHETSTYHHVEQAIANRRMHEEIEQNNRMMEHLADVRFFMETFPTIQTNSPSSSSIISPQNTSPRTPQSESLPPVVEVTGESSAGSTKWIHQYQIPPLPKSRSTSRNGLGIDLGGEKMQASWPFVERVESIQSNTRSSQ